MWDRMVLRVIVDYTSEAGFARLIRTAAAPVMNTTITKSELESLQKTVPTIPIPSSTLGAIEQLRKELNKKGIAVSDRRWKWAVCLLQAQALLEGRGAVEEDDLMILKDALWATPEQRSEIGRMTARLANPLNAKAVETGDQVDSVFKLFKETQTNASSKTEQMNAAVEANVKVKEGLEVLNRLIEQARAQGRSTSRIEKVLEEVTEKQKEICEVILL
jgi:MoxR-like ATPase